MLYGRRPVFLLSSLIFFGGLVGCAVAPTYKALLACRLVVGLGGGTTEGLAAALINVRAPVMVRICEELADQLNIRISTSYMNVELSWVSTLCQSTLASVSCP